MLTQAAESGIDLRDFYKGVRSPRHWLGPPFADFLRKSWQGGPLCASEDARRELRSSSAIVRALSHGKNLIQKTATETFRKHIVKPLWDELL